MLKEVAKSHLYDVIVVLLSVLQILHLHVLSKTLSDVGSFHYVTLSAIITMYIRCKVNNTHMYYNNVTFSDLSSPYRKSSLLQLHCVAIKWRYSASAMPIILTHSRILIEPAEHRQSLDNIPTRQRCSKPLVQPQLILR